MSSTKNTKSKGTKARLECYIANSLQDWSHWFTKLKWSFISFKFLSFFGFCGLLVCFWYGSQKALKEGVEVAKALHKEGFIKEEHVKEIVINGQTAIYDHAFGHVATVAVGVLVAIVALKAVAQHVEGKLVESGKDLNKYIKKND